MRIFGRVKVCLVVSAAVAGSYCCIGLDAAFAEFSYAPNAMPTAQPTFFPTPQFTEYPTMEPIEISTVAPPVDSGDSACAQNSLLTILSSLPDTIGTVSSANIENLINRLGSDDFAERELAQEVLYRLGYQAYIALSGASWQSPDAEIRRRASRILEWIGNTGYSGAFLAVPSRAMATIDTDAVPTSSKLEITLQIESRIPGLSVRLRNDGTPEVERILSVEGDFVLTQPYAATFANGAAGNSIDIVITNFTPAVPQEVNHGETVHMEITLPVTISLGCLPGGVNATLVFNIETAQIEIRYVGTVLEEG